MAGERTPDTSHGDSSSGTSTDNDISLREHMQRQIDQQARYFERIIAEMRIQLDERFVTQTQVLESRCDIEGARHSAALAASDSHIQMQLTNAATALNKAETATDKRFESVNEFRQQLGDQTQTFMPRTEADVRFGSMGELVATNAKKLNDIELRVQSRLDISQGKGAGMTQAWGYVVGAVGLAGGVVALVLAFTH